MAFLKLEIPPGMVRPSTEYEAMGRWYRGSHVRWFAGALQPVGGYLALTGGSAAAVGNPVRGMLAWRLNNGTAYLALGTANKVYSAEVLSDITPSSGFTAGSVSASGDYYARVEATTWQLDTYGEDLVAVSRADGKILYWDASVGVGTPAAALTNAPTSCLGVVVTPERFVVALGASGDPRLVKWSDQEAATTWTADLNNQAGDFTLSGGGQIMAGRRGRNETLIWTDLDLYAMRYIGGELVYSFPQVGENCGAISRRSMASSGGVTYWMGPRGFYVYDGAVRELRCDVGDYVFDNLNRNQASKIWGVVNTDFHEVTWHYPASSDDCEYYVTYNYSLGIWYFGQLYRTAGVDRGFLEYPVQSDIAGGLWRHEIPAVACADNHLTISPFVESGPLELGNGDQVMHIRQYVPDERTLGQVETILFTRMYPTATETQHGPYTNVNPTDLRLTARQVRIQHSTDVNGTAWRLGTPRLEVVPGGLR
jgi:hypothetical protein